MDPTRNLAEQLQLCRAINSAISFNDTTKAAELAEELAVYIHALHGWLRNGGALPSQWAAKRAPLDLAPT